MSITQFQENKSSYAKRIIDDCEQLKYQANIIIFASKNDNIPSYLDSMERYLEKIRENLIAISNLEEIRK